MPGAPLHFLFSPAPTLQTDALIFPQAKQTLAAYFEKLYEERLSKGQKYLFGEAFSAADLTLASLCYPVVFPKCFDDVMVPFEDLPKSFQDDIVDLRESKIGEEFF